MSILEYAQDVNKNEEEILKVCKKIGIKVDSIEDMLSEDNIILLDNELMTEKAEEITEEDIEDELEDELEDKAEVLALHTKIDIENSNKKEKLKKVVINTNTFNDDKKELYKKREKLMTNENNQLDDVILYKEGMTVSELASSLNVSASELIKKLFNLGVMTTLNNSINFDVAEMLVVDYNKNLKKEETADISNFEEYEILDNEDNLEERPPVITIMGHVDHGKTSLLDYIRKTEIVAGEAGGITQAIGAYQVTHKEKKLTFIDTPGHEAFTEMRARGASITDIVIIVVAADDGIKPQTREAIDHAKAANVPIIVAINKMDKPNINPDRVLTELVENGLTPEEWGGDVIVTKISAVTGLGIEDLLDTLLLVSEMKELKANLRRYASGTVIEASMNKNTGVVASVLVQNGTLRLGDPVVIGTSYGKIRAIKNDKGQNVTEVLPSTPVEVTGLSDLPQAGDKFMAFETERQARTISEERKSRARELDTNKSGMSLDELFGAVKTGIKEVNVIVKTDVNGSLEAVKGSLQKLKIDEVRVNVIRGGVGTITESDITLAKASNAIIIGFNVKPASITAELAKDAKVEIRLYNIIYKVVEDIEAAMKGMLEPIFEEKIFGTAEIRAIFKFSKVGNIAGSHVINGTVKSNSKARVIRDGVIVYTGKIKSIQREKDQAKEVGKGFDCGITLDNYQDIKENDIIESFELIEIKR